MMKSIFLLLASASLCQAYFPANESTYLNFVVPHDLHNNHSWPHITAGFGRFGMGAEGSMVLPVKMLPANEQLHLCDSIHDQIDVVKKLNIPADQGAPFMLLIERGGCTFVKKVRNAQQLGASAVLIADTEHEHLPSSSSSSDDPSDDHPEVYFFDSDPDPPHPSGDDSNHTGHESQRRLADDGSGRDISIPSMMIAKKEYMALRKVLDLKNNHTGTVVAEIAWHVPKYSWKVAMELWASPVDQHTKEFIASNFSAIARAFDLNEMHGNTHENDSYNEKMNLMRFRERPVLMNGKVMGCIGNTDAPDEPCYKLCTNGGRYCHPSHRHTDGRDIVHESLRRLCIAKHYKSPKFYWDYIDRFNNICWDADNFEDPKCVQEAMKHAGIDHDSIARCISDSGNPENDQENSLLQDALDMQFHRGVHQSPTVMINHEVSPFITWQGMSVRTVLFALCETFAYGEKPHVCYACMQCGDPVACAKRSPMKCIQGDGQEKEDPNAHTIEPSGKKGDDKKHNHKGHRVFRWFFGLFLVGGCFGGYVYYKKNMEEQGVFDRGSYSLQDAFLSDNS